MECCCHCSLKPAGAAGGHVSHGVPEDGAASHWRPGRDAERTRCVPSESSRQRKKTERQQHMVRFYSCICRERSGQKGRAAPGDVGRGREKSPTGPHGNARRCAFTLHEEHLGHVSLSPPPHTLPHTTSCHTMPLPPRVCTGMCGIISDWEVCHRMWTGGWEVMAAMPLQLQHDHSEPGGTHKPATAYKCW